MYFFYLLNFLVYIVHIFIILSYSYFFIFSFFFFFYFYIVLFLLYFFFFFFQAEDGIRDKLVTGVQTCALPILNPCPFRQARSSLRFTKRTRIHRQPEAWDGGFPRYSIGSAAGGSRGGLAVRSEERRVGKECRSRWSTYQVKEKGGEAGVVWSVI